MGGMAMDTLVFSDFQRKFELPALEHDVLAWWDATGAFNRSVEERPEDRRYVFYDGPPFATGLPHYGHILASAIKDVFPRYFTMKGFRVSRVWGWDCHGIPIENMIEGELGLKGGKKDIEAMGIDKFNAACRAAILRFDKEWQKVIRRIGRWVDFDHSYKTMDRTYMESVWWAFKSLVDKGLVYEGRRVILYCPRCATPLSNFEIAMDNSYKDVSDNSIYVLFRVVGADDEYLVAWTTTPWTLIGNVALAVDPDATYVKVHTDRGHLWVAEKLKEKLFGADAVVEDTKTGTYLVGMEYEPLYPYMPLEGKKAHYVVPATFVSLDDGTGIVHTAAIFGEDDYKLAVKLDLPCVPTLDDQGRFLPFVTPLAGVFYKKAEQWVIDDLTSRGLMFRAEKVTHSYPFCYRCETPLYFNAVPAWFVDVAQMKPALAAQNEHINWFPGHLKHGRFGKGLDTAPDWNISRSRYWGTPMPVWVGEKSGKKRFIGSVEELKRWAVDPAGLGDLPDIHREFLDSIEVWVDDAKTEKGKRIPEVFDCWVESGSMPYASIHYPFENRELFEATHPAQFIAEYIAQTRAWFYTLHVMSVGLFGSHTFENAVTTGTILAEDGAKMSKSKKNYPDPTLVLERYGADALRFYLLGSVVMKADNLNFSEAGVKEVYQKLINILWNTLTFLKLYRPSVTAPERPPVSEHLLDRWLVSRTSSMVRDVTASMDGYDTPATCHIIQDYVTDLSTWYVRRSRERIREDETAAKTLAWALDAVARVMAPVTPFIAELVYRNIHGESSDSVHLAQWPVAYDASIDAELERGMATTRLAVEKLHAKRKEANVGIRQPLASATITNLPSALGSEFTAIIMDELNVKAVSATAGEGEMTATLDTTLTPELVAEGKARDLVRKVQGVRKDAGLKIDARIVLTLPPEYKDMPQALLDGVKRDTLADDVVWGDTIAVSILQPR